MLSIAGKQYRSAMEVYDMDFWSELLMRLRSRQPDSDIPSEIIERVESRKAQNVPHVSEPPQPLGDSQKPVKPPYPLISLKKQDIKSAD
jgi:hypothetical protein